MGVSKYFCDLYKSAVNVIYPPLCLICGLDLEGEALVCRRCKGDIERTMGGICGRCGAAVESSKESCICRNLSSDLTRVRSSVLYTGVARGIVHLFKFGGYWSLASLLADRMIEDGRSLVGLREAVAVVGVPLHRVRLRERGYDQARMLARVISKRLGLECVDGMLRRRRNTRPQARLSLEERRQNLRDAFYVRDPSKVEDRTILLVDDVTTTGITLSSCATVLARVGAREVLALTFARRMLN
ncbi:MAG: ComF family protein [Candidatus Glassbacteria bacterium]